MDIQPSASPEVSRRTALRALGAAGAGIAAAGLTSKPASAAATEYVIRHDQPRQTIWGLGVEIQSDSIGSGNDGLPTATTSVPHDLVASERTRFYQQMLKAGRPDRGFRYLRLALGLYLRGLDADRKHIIGRWPEQMAELAELVQQSAMEGVSAEYWSPAPHWKSNGSFIHGSLASFTPAFLEEFGDAVVQDLQYLTANSLPVAMWGLQNEPNINGGALYSKCEYSNEQYYSAFKAVAPKIRAAFPNVFIHNESFAGQTGRGSALIRGDAATLALVDGWSWHRIGADSNEQITTDFRANSVGKPVINNEFEYLSGGTSDWRMVNTAQSIMNWMTFQNSPTWFWLHALKPTYNAEAAGYSLGFWRPWDDDDFSKFAHIQKGHWDFNPGNWHAVKGFVEYMPWNSVRYHVDETTVRNDQRIMAWKTPQGKLAFALTNRGTANFTFTVDTGSTRTFGGKRFNFTANDISVGTKTGPVLTATLSPKSIEFWIEDLPSTVTDIIVDNSSAEFSGVWPGSTFRPNYYGSNYQHHAAGGTGTDWVKWRGNIPVAGNYAVYVWLPDGSSDRATNAKFIVFHDGASTIYTVNQTLSGGAWKLLGTHYMSTAPTGNGVVQLTDEGNSTYVVADAVRFLKQ